MFYNSVMTRLPRNPDEILRARGADARPAARFEPYCAEREHDGWDIPIEQSLLRTEVAEERARSIITRNRSPDVPFDRSVNPYRGCEHGCIYCFARPSHAYLGLSPGLDFETRLIAKTNAAAVLEQQLSKPGYVPAPINLLVPPHHYVDDNTLVIGVDPQGAA